MMNDPIKDELDPKLRQQLQQLKDVPERDLNLAAQNRAKYLAMAHRLAAEQRSGARQHAAVSATPFLRLKEWIGSIYIPIFRKERFSMVSVLATIAIVLGLVFGGAGATVYAAQDSQPGETLYDVKTLSEDVRLELTTNPDTKFQLALELANRRILELSTLSEAGEPVPLALATRLQSHMRLALNLASEMEPEDQTVALLAVQRQIQDQDRIMGQTMANAPDFTDPVMAIIRSMNQYQLRLVETGLGNPQEFQYRLRNGQPSDDGTIEDLDAEIPSNLDAGYGPGPGPGPNEEPGEGQIGPMGTPEVRDGYGPGPAECDPDTPCEPAYDGTGNQYGPNNPDAGGPQGSMTPPDDSGGTGSKKP